MYNILTLTLTHSTAFWFNFKVTLRGIQAIFHCLFNFNAVNKLELDLERL